MTSPRFSQALAYWLRLGCLSFGGPAGQIAMMQSDLVDRRQWIDQRKFLNALNFCMLLPGPEAQQLATYCGWRLHGVWGGLAAGLLFILPGAVVLGVLAWVAAAHGDVPLIQAVFSGIQPTVIAIIAVALYRLGRRALTGPAFVVLAVAALAAVSLADIDFPFVVAGAAIAGLILGRFGQAGAEADADPNAAESAADGAGGWALRLTRIFLLWLLAWSVPVLPVLLVLGAEPYAGIVELFTTAAFVSFGGAYAVLPYIAERAVEVWGWLTPADMVRGLALAETTPGPLILVTQFVGFFAGFTTPGALSPVAAGLIAAALTLHVTFLPSFLFIFAGAPVVERLAANRTARAALAGVTAAVVGVIADLGLFLANVTLWMDGGPLGLDPIAVALALAALAAMTWGRLGVPWVVLGGGLAGAVLY